MTLATLGIDAYQLTTLLTHADEGRLDHEVTMAFFFRRMPRERRFVVFSGLRRILEHAEQMSLDPNELDALRAHSAIGPALAARPEVFERLRTMRGFRGAIDAMPEGSVAFAGPASRTDGTPLVINDTPLSIYTPLLQVRTDLLRAKLIETPWLGYINHMSMVASKAARVVNAAGDRPVMELGSRRTHPDAALDAAWAAWVAGVAATSNVAAFAHWGITSTGTMDHFAIQASERPGMSRLDSERGFFRAYAKTFEGIPTTMLVDTYDTERGIRHAVAATDGKLAAIRIDSNVTPQSLTRARQLLADLGSPQTKIYVSDALDENRVAELRDLADGFGVGENIVCSPDSAAGIGAVAKLVVNGYGGITMKVAKGTGKATLPGELQVWRFSDHDVVALASEPPLPGARSMLAPVWRGDARVDASDVREDLAAARSHAKAEIASLPPSLRSIDRGAASRKLVASDALVAQIEELVAVAEDNQSRSTTTSSNRS
jgi:nicotinate phosphoribosyltransferase